MVKKLIGFVVLSLFLFSNSYAQSKYFWRYANSTTDCTAITDGKPTDLCFQENTNELYKCNNTTCNTPATWVKVAGAGEVSFYNGTALAGNNTKFRIISGTGITQVWANTSEGANVTITGSGGATNPLWLNSTQSSKIQKYANNSLDLVNNVTYSTGMGYSLNMTNIQVGTVPSTFGISGNQNFTLETWIKIWDDAYAGGNRHFLNLGLNGLGNVVFLNVPSGTNTLQMSWYGGGGTINSASPLVVGAWQHVVGVYNGTNSIIYINGSQVGVGIMSTSDINSTGSLDINCFSAGLVDGDVSNITLDSIAIWGKALNATEIAARYNSGAGQDLIGNETDLAAYFRCNENTGTALIDVVNNNNATHNGTWTTGKVQPLSAYANYDSSVIHSENGTDAATRSLITIGEPYSKMTIKSVSLNSTGNITAPYFIGGLKGNITNCTNITMFNATGVIFNCSLNETNVFVCVP